MTDIKPLLTDEEIINAWYRHAATAEPGERRLAFGRAIERATIAALAQAQGAEPVALDWENPKIGHPYWPHRIPPRGKPLPDGWLDDYITDCAKLKNGEMPGVYFVQGVRFAEQHHGFTAPPDYEAMKAELECAQAELALQRKLYEGCKTVRDALAAEVERLKAAQPKEAIRQALLHAAKVIELYDDATMQADHMLDSTECADIIEGLADMYASQPQEAGQAREPKCNSTWNCPKCGAGECVDVLEEIAEREKRWSAQSSPAVPEGYEVVPSDATAEMINAAFDELNRQYDPRNVSDPDFQLIYQAMLAAAPSAPQQKEGDKCQR